ncbi:hypothetical protein JH06_3746 [Blastocystis sp. subtype 4]|uniref:hypothetical protein n=1 Tax=Blastocystis sp. subtype 4 TaxID=944170 RepID=UPI0007118A21|nr:hypothetical protein JH06_3746 [Blastocystis sp. subtype 4]KNB44353.1 hypothetical protein JH06_3746 [Blastocystis sp. subtype 4]|eukprot:XP_014527804.1 hypothetical protein JH06_3746 [Blastocystis sp. subtype 4]
MNRGFDSWFVECSLYQKFGLKEFYVVLIQPFYRMKLTFLQNMIRSTAQSMEIGRNSVQDYLNKASYEEFIARKQKERRENKEPHEKSREFDTQHSFYIHDKTNNPHLIINSREGPSKDYRTIPTIPFNRYSNWKELESGSDCDVETEEVSPTDVMQVGKEGIQIDAKKLTESLADFFSDVADEDEMARELTQSLDLFEKKTGEDKVTVEQPVLEEKSSELKVTPYDIPKTWKGSKQGKESIDMSDDEINDESEYVSKVLQYSQTEPAVSGKEKLEYEMGYSKGLYVCSQLVQTFVHPMMSGRSFKTLFMTEVTNNEKEEVPGRVEEAPAKTFRFIDRDVKIGRSTGRFNIIRVGENSSYIYLEDWFHTISSQSTSKYLVSVFFWATLFYLFRDYGFVDITTYVAAMIISLETITTVGYSVTDINFGDHTIAFFLLYCEMMQAILMNSFCIGLIYTRLSRAITRSRSLIFTDKAVVRKVNGQWCLVFQVCELRRQQLLESHVSCYCVQKTISSTSGVPYQMSRMQLTVGNEVCSYAKHPSDIPGCHLILMLPAVIVSLYFSFHYSVILLMPLLPSIRLQS